jgi:hypothetical protein
LSGYHSLAFVQEVAFFRASRHQERRNETKDYCEKAFEEEDVTPGVQDHRKRSPRRNTRKTVYRLATGIRCQDCGSLHRGEKAPESSSHGSSGDVYTNAEQEFVALVEAGNEEGKTTRYYELEIVTTSNWEDLRHDTTLKYTKTGPSSQQSLKAFHEGTAERYEPKATYQER